MFRDDSERLNQCAEFIDRQLELLSQGQLEEIAVLEESKQQLLHEIDWPVVKQNAVLLATATALEEKQSDFETRCAGVREELASELSNQIKRGRAITAYKSQ